MRKLIVVVAALAAALTWALPARAVDDLTVMTNNDRAAHRLGSLAPAGDIVAFAQRRAEEMARDQRIYHTTDLGGQVGNWKRLGENVGRGKSLGDIEAAFMASPAHRENILSPDYTEIGVGQARSGDLIYVAVIFRLPQVAQAPAPAPTTTTAPRPAPKPVAQAPRRAEVKPLAAPTPPPAPPAPPETTTTTAAPPPPPVVESAPVVAALPEPPPAPVLVDTYGLEAAGQLPWSLPTDVLGTTESASAVHSLVREPDLVRPLAAGTAMVGIGYVGTMLFEEARRRRRLAGS